MTLAKQMDKHIMFSYQWNSEDLVSKIYFYLKRVQNISLWMDKHGGMNESLSESMAKGVENCCVLVCFLTAEYQESINCKKELTYAVQLHKPIIPCFIGNVKWKPSHWLGITITDLLYLNLTNIDDHNFENKCHELLNKINSVLGITQLEHFKESQNLIEEQNDEEDSQRNSLFILPAIIREGPQINDEICLIIPSKYSSEGDSFIRLINQSTQIQCNQDLYSKNGRFINSFTLPRLLFHNTSSQSLSILQLSAEYENISNGSNQWIPCQLKINGDEDIINIDPNKLLGYSITIQIESCGSPGIDNEHRFRAHHLLPQPLRLKLSLEDSQMKHASLIIEQVNQPLNLATLDKLISKLNICQSNILAFVWADDCSIDIRYFGLIYYLNNNLIFSFGCDLSSLRSPSWDKQFLQALQKTAKKERKTELIVHEDVFHPFIHCKVLFDEYYKLQAIRITIKTNTSRTEQTIPLPLQQIFSESQFF